MKKIQAGISLPNSIDNISELAQLCEELGFDSVWTVDAVLDEFVNPTYDFRVCMTALANATKKIKIGSCVMATCKYYPFNIARFYAALDRYSKGRVIMGLGAGVARQAVPYGIPPISNMLERFKETLEVIQLLFHQKQVTYEGKYFQLNSVSLESQSLQKPHPPIWLGTNINKAIQETAEFADGWLPGVTAPEIYSSELRIFHEAAKRTRNDIKNVVPACFEIINISENKETSLKRVGKLLAPTGMWWNRYSKLGYKKFNSPNQVPNEVIEKLNILGSISDCGQRIGEFADAGLKHIVLYPMPIKDIPKILPKIIEAIELV